MRKNPFKIYINCSYDLEEYLNSDHYELEFQIGKIAKKYHGMETGSGAGFGQRDLNYEFETLAGVKQFYKEIHKIMPKIKIKDANLTYSVNDIYIYEKDALKSYILYGELDE